MSSYFNHVNILYQFRLTLSSLLYPFRWPHPIILNLPEKLFELLESPVTIIMGINKGIDYLRDHNLIDNNPHLIFVCLDDHYLFHHNKDNLNSILANIPDFKNLKNNLRNFYNLLNRNKSLNFNHEREKHKNF